MLTLYVTGRAGLGNLCLDQSVKMATEEKALLEDPDQKPFSASPIPPIDGETPAPGPQKKGGSPLNVSVVKFAIKYMKFVGVALGIWFMGWLGLSYVWVLCGLLIFMIWKLNKEKKDKKRVILQEAAEMAADGAISPRMEDLPAWVRSSFFPNFLVQTDLNMLSYQYKKSFLLQTIK